MNGAVRAHGRRTAWALAAALLAPTGATALEEVPFITTPDNVTQTMLEMAKVGPQDTVLDLGSGDGRIVIVAAKRFGARGMGVEIDPRLVDESNANARRAGVDDRVRFVEQDLFKTDLSAASVITMYLLPDVNLKLRPAVLALKPGTRVVSHDWDMGDWAPDRTVTVPVPDKVVGREKLSRVHLWVVPAQVSGLWCGAGPLRSFSLRLDQTFQRFRGTLKRKSRTHELVGVVDGLRMVATYQSKASLELAVQGQQLRIVKAPGDLWPLRGLAFERTAGSDCPR
jgi:SAM-dependent methyltransferase